MPTLEPWHITTSRAGQALRLRAQPLLPPRRRRTGSSSLISTASSSTSPPRGLIAAKANAGEVDLLSRGLSMGDIPVLKEGEKAKGYRTLLWPVARGSAFALVPQPHHQRPGLARLNARRALPPRLVARHRPATLNNALLFGLGTEGNNTVVAESAALRRVRTARAGRTTIAEAANRLLDEIGLTERNGAGIRLLPDGRPLEIIVETRRRGRRPRRRADRSPRSSGARSASSSFVKPQERTILRNRSYAGMTVMVAGQGLDNALPTPVMPPTELAPMRAGQLRLAEMGPVRRDQGQDRRAGRHARGQGADAALQGVDVGERRRDQGGRLAGDAATSMPRTSSRSAPSPARSSRSSSPTSCATSPTRRSIPGSRRRCSAPTASTSSISTTRPGSGHPMISYLARRIATMVVTLLLISALVFLIIKLPPGDFLTNQIEELRSQGDSASAREGRPPALRIRARSARLVPIRDLARRLARAPGLLGPAAGRLGLVLRVPAPGGRSGRQRARLDPSRQPRGDPVHPCRRDPHRDLLGDAPQYPRQPRHHLPRLYRPGDAELPPRPRSAVLPQPMVRRVDRRHDGPQIPANADWSLAKVGSVLAHLVVPVMVIGLAGTAGMIRRLRANLLDELNRQYTLTAKAKGLPPTRALLKYPLRIALNPFVADIGNLLPSIVSGSVLVSLVLSLPTVGPILLQSPQDPGPVPRRLHPDVRRGAHRRRDADRRPLAGRPRPSHPSREAELTR